MTKRTKTGTQLVRFEEPRLVQFEEPHLVQIFHDGVEVARIVGGVVEFDHTVKKVPVVLEIRWDEVVVYRLEHGKPVINLMAKEVLFLQGVHRPEGTESLSVSLPPAI